MPEHFRHGVMAAFSEMHGISEKARARKCHEIESLSISEAVQIWEMTEIHEWMTNSERDRFAYLDSLIARASCH